MSAQRPLEPFRARAYFYMRLYHYHFYFLREIRRRRNLLFRGRGHQDVNGLSHLRTDKKRPLLGPAPDVTTCTGIPALNSEASQLFFRARLLMKCRADGRCGRKRLVRTGTISLPGLAWPAAALWSPCSSEWRPRREKALQRKEVMDLASGIRCIQLQKLGEPGRVGEAKNVEKHATHALRGEEIARLHVE